MLIRRPDDLGAFVRQYRKTQGLSQAQLAARLQTTQKWISHLENGKPSAQIGLVLRALNEIGASIEVRLAEELTKTPEQSGLRPVKRNPFSIDDIVDG
jgi:HTH-type transcriptional regulator / antitoxin HipB